jgi:integrase
MVRRVTLPYLWRHPKGALYFRRDGRYVPLPEPTDPEFHAAYDAAKRGPRVVGKRTVDALVASYRRTSSFAAKADRTRQDYDKVLAYLVEKIGGRDVSVITRPAILEAMERNRHRARFANYIAQIASIICEHAVDLGWLRQNPVKGVKLLKLGDGHKVWPAKAIDAYRAAATGNALLIFELCLGTGQRIGDVLRMRWSDIEDGAIKVKQGKTGNELWIPLTPRLAVALDACPRRGLCIVAGDDSRPLSYRRAAYSFDAARGPSGTDDYTIHGLRHSTASELAEAGCTDAQIAAVTGHKSLRMVAKYRAGSDQRRLAKEAMGKRERNGDGT